jgi:hypothetical protein
MKDRTVMVPQTIERQSCSPGSFGFAPRCYQFPETVMVERIQKIPETRVEYREMIISEPPKSYSLSKNKFSELASHIEAAEKEGKELSLAQIQGFQ